MEYRLVMSILRYSSFDFRDLVLEHTVLVIYLVKYESYILLLLHISNSKLDYLKYIDTYNYTKTIILFYAL